MSECKHIFNAHAQCQWCHRMKKDIEYEDMKAEIERLQKDRSRSENELDRLREWVAAVEDGYDKQKAEIERLRTENKRLRGGTGETTTKGRMEEGMSKYSDLDIMIDVYDPKTYIDGCKCDPDVNYTCELCMTYNTLREAKRMLLLRDTEIGRLQSAYDGFTPAQYHAGLSKLWTAIGNPPLDGRDVFTRVADEIVALKAIINAKLYQRKCHDCGHVGWYADSRPPYCLCDRCRSQNTRLVKEQK